MHRFFLLLSLITVAAMAQEDPTNHLRLEVQTMPKKAEITASGFGQTATSDVEFDTANRLGIGYWYGHSADTAFRLGVGLDFSTLEIKNSGEKLTISEYGLFIEPGVTIPVDTWLAVEGGVRLGLGGVKTTTSVPGQTIDDTSYGEGSLRARLVATFDAGLELFVGGGYLAQQFTYKSSFLGSDVDVKVKPSGGFLGLGAGWRF